MIVTGDVLSILSSKQKITILPTVTKVKTHLQLMSKKKKKTMTVNHSDDPAL